MVARIPERPSRLHPPLVLRKQSFLKELAWPLYPRVEHRKREEVLGSTEDHLDAQVTRLRLFSDSSPWQLSPLL